MPSSAWRVNGETLSQWAKIHAADIIRSLERDVFPMIRDLPISRATAACKVLEVLKDIEDRGAVETAKRVRQRISSVFIRTIAKALPRRTRPRNWARC
jgi:integrase